MVGKDGYLWLAMENIYDCNPKCVQSKMKNNQRGPNQRNPVDWHGVLLLIVHLPQPYLLYTSFLSLFCSFPNASPQLIH